MVLQRGTLLACTLAGWVDPADGAHVDHVFSKCNNYPEQNESFRLFEHNFEFKLQSYDITAARSDLLMSFITPTDTSSGLDETLSKQQLEKSHLRSFHFEPRGDNNSEIVSPCNNTHWMYSTCTSACTCSTCSHYFRTILSAES